MNYFLQRQVGPPTQQQNQSLVAAVELS